MLVKNLQQKLWKVVKNDEYILNNNDFKSAEIKMAIIIILKVNDVNYIFFNSTWACVTSIKGIYLLFVKVQDGFHPKISTSLSFSSMW